MNFTKVDGTSVMRLFRWIKVLRMGRHDIQECKQASPFGIDSNPIKGMVAVYDVSGTNGEAVIVVYVHKHNIAAAGETRIFCTNDDDEEQFYVWLKKNGTLELGGDQYNLVRYQQLETAFNQLRSDFNALVANYNAHQHTYINSAGNPAATTVGVVNPANGVVSTADMSSAKINEIKTL